MAEAKVYAPSSIVALIDAVRAAKGRDRQSAFAEHGFTGSTGRKYTEHLPCATSPKRNGERLQVLRLHAEGKSWREIVRETGLPKARVWRVVWSLDAEAAARAAVALEAEIRAAIESGVSRNELILSYSSGVVDRIREELGLRKDRPRIRETEPKVLRDTARQALEAEIRAAIESGRTSRELIAAGHSVWTIDRIREELRREKRRARRPKPPSPPPCMTRRSAPGNMPNAED